MYYQFREVNFLKLTKVYCKIMFTNKYNIICLDYIDVYLEFLTGQIKIFINSSHSPVYTPSCSEKLVSSLIFVKIFYILWLLTLLIY